MFTLTLTEEELHVVQEATTAYGAMMSKLKALATDDRTKNSYAHADIVALDVYVKATAVEKEGKR